MPKKTKRTTKKEIEIPPTKTQDQIEINRGNVDVLIIKLLSMINTQLVDIKLTLKENKDGGHK